MDQASARRVTYDHGMAHTTELSRTVPGRNGGTLTPVQKGQRLNPTGRPSGGASIKEWYNALQDTPEAELRKIARDKKESPARRRAALEWLDTLGCDMADFAPFLDGELSLKELRSKGINTRFIKKASVTTKTYTGPHGVTNEQTATLELLHKDGLAADRIMDRTHGKPVQPILVERRITDPARIMERLQALFDAFPEVRDRLQPLLTPALIDTESREDTPCITTPAQTEHPSD